MPNLLRLNVALFTLITLIAVAALAGTMDARSQLADARHNARVGAEDVAKLTARLEALERAPPQQGPPGPAGPTGPQGARGPAGPQGPAASTTFATRSEEPITRREFEGQMVDVHLCLQGLAGLARGQTQLTNNVQTFCH